MDPPTWTVSPFPAGCFFLYVKFNSSHSEQVKQIKSSSQTSLRSINESALNQTVFRPYLHQLTACFAADFNLLADNIYTGLWTDTLQHSIEQCSVWALICLLSHGTTSPLEQRAPLVLASQSISWQMKVSFTVKVARCLCFEITGADPPSPSCISLCR